MAAAQDQRQKQRHREAGAEMIPPAQGFAALGELMARGVSQMTVLPVRWSAVLKDGQDVPPLLADMGREAEPPPKKASKPKREMLLRLAEAPEAERGAMVVGHVREEALKVLGLDLQYALSLDQPLSELGLDSLMAVELRNSLEASLGTSLPATLLFDYPSVGALAGLLSQKIPANGAAAGKEETAHQLLAAARTGGVEAAVGDLSVAEMDRLLEEMTRKGPE
jgi:acyl carrier protein